MKENYVYVNSELVWGDVTFDGEVNVLDIQILVNFVLGFDNPTQEQVLVGDMDQNGSINILDLVYVVNIILDADNNQE